MRLHAVLSTVLAALALSACDRSTEPAGPAPIGEGAGDSAAVANGPPVPVETDVGTGTETTDMGVRVFSCESGHRVVLVGEDVARVTLADGRVIELPRKSDGVAEYRGEALTFDLGEDGQGGTLGQDEVGGFACEPAD